MGRKMAFAFAGIAALVAGLAMAADGFDEFGYNETARLFLGPADGVDRNLDGLYYGTTTWANDQLKMKWNAEWDRGNDEGWLNPPYDAWIDNNWNGHVQNGSDETWQYRIIWVGTDLASSDRWRDGGYAIWDQFEVIFSHGTAPNEHFWDAHASPGGFGGSSQ